MAEIEPKLFTELAMLLEQSWVIKAVSGWHPGAQRMELKIIAEKKAELLGSTGAEWLHTVGHGYLGDD